MKPTIAVKAYGAVYKSIVFSSIREAFLAKPPDYSSNTKRPIASGRVQARVSDTGC